MVYLGGPLHQRVNLGLKSKRKVARRARAGQTFPLDRDPGHWEAVLPKNPSSNLFCQFVEISSPFFLGGGLPRATSEQRDAAGGGSSNGKMVPVFRRGNSNLPVSGVAQTHHMHCLLPRSSPRNSRSTVQL